MVRGRYVKGIWRTENKIVLIMTTSYNHNPVLGTEQAAGFCRPTPLVNAEQQAPVLRDMPPDVRKEFHSAKSPLMETSLPRLGEGILAAAAILGSLLVRLLALAFETEISALKRLQTQQEEQRFRDEEVVSRCQGCVSRWDWAI
jgi:hypothetical protein